MTDPTDETRPDRERYPKPPLGVVPVLPPTHYCEAHEGSRFGGPPCANCVPIPAPPGGDDSARTDAEVEPTVGNVAILQRGITVIQMQRDEARAEALQEAADAWMVEGRAVIHNHAHRDLTAHQRIAQWIRDRALLAAAPAPTTSVRPVMSAVDLLRSPETPDHPPLTGGLARDVPVVEIPAPAPTEAAGGEG